VEFTGSFIGVYWSLSDLLSELSEFIESYIIVIGIYWGLLDLYQIFVSDMGVGRPAIQTTWSTPHVSAYWNIRLSVAGAAMDAQVQNDILLSDFTRNLVVVGRRPHPGPKFAS